MHGEKGNVNFRSMSAKYIVTLPTLGIGNRAVIIRIQLPK